MEARNKTDERLAERSIERTGDTHKVHAHDASHVSGNTQGDDAYAHKRVLSKWRPTERRRAGAMRGSEQAKRRKGEGERASE